MSNNNLCCPNYLIFPLKNPDRDKNGVYRILNKWGFGNREIDFEKMFKQLCEADCLNKKLVIIADTTISGSQSIKALEYYTRVFNDEEELKKIHSKLFKSTERYSQFENIDAQRIFNKNLKSLPEITISTPIITTEFKTKISQFVFFKGKIINWFFNKEIGDKKYLFGEILFNNDHREILKIYMRILTFFRKFLKYQMLMPIKTSTIILMVQMYY